MLSSREAWRGAKPLVQLRIVQIFRSEPKRERSPVSDCGAGLFQEVAEHLME